MHERGSIRDTQVDEADVRALHAALNDLLALFWNEAQDLNVEAALDALARRPDLPLTVAFAAEVRQRAGQFLLRERPRRSLSR